MRQQRPGEPGEEGGDDEGERAVLPSADPDRLGQLVLPMDRVEGEPDRRALEPIHDPDRHRHHHEAEVVVVVGLEEIDAQRSDLDVGEVGDQLQPLGAAEGVAEALPEQADDLTRREGPDQEVKALHAKERKAQDEGDEGRGASAQQHRDRHRHAQTLGEQRAGIGAHTHDHDMTQRPLAGQGQETIADHEQHVDHQEDGDLLLREAQDLRQGEEHRIEQDQAQDPLQVEALITHVP